MSDGILLAGNIFVDRLNEQGVSTGQIFGPINTTKLGIKAEADSVVRTSNKKGSKGQALDDVKIGKPTVVTWEFDDQPAEMIALALMGDVAAINDAAGTLTDEAITMPANQSWVAVPGQNFTNDVVVKQATVTLAVGVDYEFNFALGMVRAIKGGALDAGGSITVTGSYNARSGKRINGATVSQTRLRIFGEGTNLANGKQVNFEIYDTSMMPTSELDLASSEFVTAALEGTAKLVTGKKEPYYIDELDAE